MADPSLSFQDDRKLVHYLLGLLPEEDAERLDEESIVDDGVAARLCDVENDLVDAYVSGRLEGEILARFESHYLMSPRRREGVQFARRFLDAVDPAPGDAPAAVPTAQSAARQAWRVVPVRDESRARVSMHVRVVWALAAAALLVLTCGVVLFQNVRLQRGLSETQGREVALDRSVQALAGQLDEQRAVNRTTIQELDRLRAAQPTVAMALVLLPQTRGAGPVSVIAVAPGARVITFDLRLETSDLVRYEVALKDPGTNRIVWRSAPLAPGGSRRLPTISVSVPASVLKPQHYAFEVSGRGPAGALELTSTYAFQLESR